MYSFKEDSLLQTDLTRELSGPEKNISLYAAAMYPDVVDKFKEKYPEYKEKEFAYMSYMILLNNKEERERISSKLEGLNLT